MDDKSNISFLISKLVHKLSPNDINSVYLAYDIIKSFDYYQSNKNASHFLKKWALILQTSGRNLEIPLLEECTSKISKSVRNPSSLFVLIDHLKKSPQEVLTFNSPSVERLYPECKNIPKDFLFVLQGIDGDNFKYDYSRKRFVFLKKLHANLYTLAKRVSNIGNMIKIIQRFLKMQNSILYQYANVIVQDIYINHLNFVSSIELLFRNLNAFQMLTLLSGKSVEEVKAATIICNTLMQNNGSFIYNILDSIALHGDSSIINIASKMKDKCFEGIQKMIRSWVSRGYVNDPFSEFFIRNKNNLKRNDNWWNDKYFIVNENVPKCLSKKMIQMIFTAGKCMSYLHEFHGFDNLDIDESLNLKQYVKCASFQSNKIMMNLISKDNFFLKSISYIHDYILLRRGDFANEISSFDLSNLPKQLYTTIHHFTEKPLFEITIKNTEKGPSLTFEIDTYPLSAIVNHFERQVYQKISIILFKLKQCKYRLINLKKSKRVFQIISYEMITFLNLITDFFQLHVIEKEYSKFLSLIRNKDITFDSLITEHSKYVSSLADEFWISSSCCECNEILVKIINNINSFVNSPTNLNKLANEFHLLIHDFKDAIIRNQVNGEKLLHHLLSTFPTIFK